MYGVWEDERDPLLNACVLLLMYAKGRHKPTMNLHRLANALEKGDTAKGTEALRPAECRGREHVAEVS